MNTELIIISEYVNHTQIEPAFIETLSDNGLIHIYKVENQHCLHYDELPVLERYARLYYDLSINMEGIDVIHNLMERIDQLNEEVRVLRNQVRFWDE